MSIACSCHDVGDLETALDTVQQTKYNSYKSNTINIINSMHIQYVMECLKSNTTQVRNIKQYLLATLYNAPTTIDSYYAAQVRHDFGWGGRSN